MAIQERDRHIECTAGVAGGKPRISGRRITVQKIVIWHQRMGKGIDEICAEYDLGPAEVHAALSYYFDHREQIDDSIDDSEEFIAALRNATPSALERRLKELCGE